MKVLELALVFVAAIGFAVWRGVSIYRYAFHRKDRGSAGEVFTR